MTWFEKLTGFSERSPNQVRNNITLEGDTLTSKVNGRSFSCGRLEIPSLGELREQVRTGADRGGRRVPRRPEGNG